jgi:2-polyprenyl-3-methyl-5-hydroxy-6-metoxy-1,4-benzoquinol methylase
MPLTAAEANQRFYAEHAELYDRTECCVVDAKQQARLNDAIDEALALLPRDPAILDACGGSGNAGVALSRHGLVPVVVDVSREMTAIWERKAGLAGLVPEIHVESVETFLQSDPRRWDLVTFCSALHHLEEPGQELAAAAARLAPGGLILTMFDPTLGNSPLRFARKADWLLELLITDTREFARLARGAATRRARREDPQASVGRMAERHAYAGIDDLDLVEQLRALGLEIVVHERYADARIGVIRSALHFARRPSHFRLLVRRPVV